MSNIDSYTEIDNPEPVCDPEEPGTGESQRLRIKVPKVFTQLTMGERLQDDDSQGYALAGFGVATEGHVFLSAGGVNGVEDSSANTMALQSVGELSLCATQGGLNLAGRSGAAIGSVGGVSISGNGGVTIAGGMLGAGLMSYWPERTHEVGEGDVRAPTPPWIQTLGDVNGTIGTIMSGVDLFAGVLSDLASSYSKTAKIPADNKSSLETLEKVNRVVGDFSSKFGKVGITYSLFGSDAVKTAGSWVDGGAGAAAFADDFINSALAGTTIFGQAGVTVGSAMSVSIYSLTGTAITSPLGVSVLAGTASITAASVIDLNAKGIQAGASANMALQAGERVSIAGIAEGVTLSGERVLLTADGVGSAVSVRDGAVDVHAKGKLSLNASLIRVGEGEAQTLAAGKAFHISVDQSANIEGEELLLRAEKSLKIEHEGGARVHLDKSHLYLGYGSPQGAPPTLPDEPEWPAQPAHDASKEEWDTFMEEYAAMESAYEETMDAYLAEVESWAKGVKHKDVNTGLDVTTSGVKLLAKGTVGVDLSSSKVKIFDLEVSK